MTNDQKNAIYSAYLGICVLNTMCRKAGLSLAQQRSQELLTELGTAFPFIAELVGLSALRTETKHRALTLAELKAQGGRCSCGGSDDYCPCQNVPDRTTLELRATETKP